MPLGIQSFHAVADNAGGKRRSKCSASAFIVQHLRPVSTCCDFCKLQSNWVPGSSPYVPGSTPAENTIWASSGPPSAPSPGKSAPIKQATDQQHPYRIASRAPYEFSRRISDRNYPEVAASARVAISLAAAESVWLILFGDLRSPPRRRRILTI
jgi:hypothetical protein